MNKVILVGRLTANPEIRTTDDKTQVSKFSLAVDRGYKDSNGNKETDFIDCVAFNKIAENFAKYCKKGSLIGVCGEIRKRSYDASDGSKRYVTEVIARQITFLAHSNNGPEAGDKSKDIVKNDDISNDPFADFGNEITISDEDLPF